MIALVEQSYWRHDADVEDVRSWAEGISDDGARDVALRYLHERAQPPSTEAETRFVVYAAQGTMREQRIYYLDNFRIAPSVLRDPGSYPLPAEVLVAGDNTPRDIDLDSCGDAATAHADYDSSLPTLPPLEDRWQLELNQTV